MKTLVITGGSRGIGLATAREFAAAGWSVVSVARRACAVAGAHHVAADLSDPGWAERHGEEVLAAVAGSDTIALVHNAGLLTRDSVASVTQATLREVLQVNLLACVQLDQLLLPRMGPGSAIVYVGSTLGEKAVAGSCAYVVSKHALVGLARATAQDLAGRRIHSVCVCPGFTDTEMLRDHVGGEPAVLASIAAGSTFGRLVEPQEIARVILFCATNPAVNGAVIHANLGQIER